MGFNAESVHVHAAGWDPEEAQICLAREIRKAVEQLSPADDAEPERATRLVLMTPAAEWVSIFDSNRGSARELACLLSQAVRRPTVTIALRDDDDYEVALYRGGGLRDRLSREKPREAPEQWCGLLQPGAALPAHVPRSNALEVLARRLGLQTEYCLASADEFFDVEDPRWTRLLFRGAAEGENAKLPVFALERHEPLRFRFAAGDDLRQIRLSAVNKGEASAGLRVELTGAALARGLIEVERARAVQFKPGLRRPEAVSSEAPFLFTEGRLRADFVGMPLRAGAPENGFVTAALLRSALIARREATITVHVLGRAMARGAGDMQIRILPLANRDGSVEASLTVEVN